jgi:hypothetical protein
MPLVRTALIATAACLIGAAAYAQPSASDGSMPPADQSTAPTAEQAAMPPADQAAPPASTGMSAQPAPTGTAANTSSTVDANGNQVIASAPVPDTKANRAAYGQPLSRAGKRTAPAGN